MTVKDNYNTFTDVAEIDVEKEISKHIDIKESHTDDHRRFDKRARNVLVISAVLCTFFIAGEVVGGVISGSLAIITDSAHLLTDLATYIISIIGLYTSRRKPTRRLTFGWYRVEIMGALVSVVLIWLVTGVLIYLATMRLIHSDYTIEPTTMLITACCGIVVNIVLMSVLFAYNRCCLGPSNEAPSELVPLHSHNHGNVNVRSALVHVASDLIQSVGVVIAAIIIFFKPEWKMADPICTYIFGVFVLFSTISILRSIMAVLMEAVPSHIKVGDVMEFLKSEQKAIDVHHVHIWSLTTNRTVMSAHVVVGEKQDLSGALPLMRRALKNKYRFSDVFLQMETVGSTIDRDSGCVCD